MTEPIGQNERAHYAKAGELVVLATAEAHQGNHEVAQTYAAIAVAHASLGQALAVARRR